jgi:hypothetical protein
MSEMISIDLIRLDGGTQPRAALSDPLAEEYAEAMRGGAELPPVTVFHDGADHWLADGFHRRRAAELLGLAEIAADVRQGTRRDAILHSVGANAAHGMRRTNDDKRRAVLTLLDDPEWSAWSDREIARQCGVSDRFVNGLRPRPASANGSQMAGKRTVSRGGSTYTMDTGGLRRPRPDDGALQRLMTAEEPAGLPAPAATPAAEAAPNLPSPATDGEGRDLDDTAFVLDRIKYAFALTERKEQDLAAGIDPARRKVIVRKAKRLSN